MWGNIVLFTRYKGLKREKLTIKILPTGTSQECSHCGHTHPDNRVTQTVFHCQECGLTANADHNAAIVIKKRGIKTLLDGKIQVKQKKSVRFRKGPSSNDNSQIGQGLPESKRASMACFTMDGPGCTAGQETTVSRTVGYPRIVLVYVNREAPTSTVSG